MSDVVISPNMMLPVPIVGQDPGPDWANNLNACLGILDQHDHSSGKGVLVTPNGLNINSDLSIGSNNLTLVKTVNFTALVSPLPGTSPNLGCVYVAGSELYYNDEVGNSVQITNGGSVNSGAGSISGLPSGTASASYSSGSGTFIWQSATSTPANMDFGSAILRNNVASSKGLTLSPPSAMAADITETLPTIPGATSFMTIDASGNMGSSIAISKGLTNSNIANQTVTQVLLAPRATGSTVAAGGFATSTSSGAQSTNVTSFADITGLTITITTTGRPVMVGLTSDGDATGVASFNVQNSATGQGGAEILFVRDVTNISQFEVGDFSSVPVNTFWPTSSCIYIEAVAAGTYTYKAQWKTNQSSTTIFISNTVLFAYEI